MLNFEEVPNDVLSGKDLDYLSDIFNWNYIALKKTNTAVNIVEDEEVSSILSRAINMFDDNLNDVLNILESRGNINE